VPLGLGQLGTPRRARFHQLAGPAVQAARHSWSWPCQAPRAEPAHHQLGGRLVAVGLPLPGAPALAAERLTESPRGQQLYELTHPAGTALTHLRLDPLELIEKLSASFPHPGQGGGARVSRLRATRPRSRLDALLTRVPACRLAMAQLLRYRPVACRTPGSAAVRSVTSPPGSEARATDLSTTPTSGGGRHKVCRRAVEWLGAGPSHWRVGLRYSSPDHVHAAEVGEGRTVRAEVTGPLHGSVASAYPRAWPICRRLVVVMLAGAPYVLGSGALAPVRAQSPAERTAPTTPSVSPIPIPEIAQRAEDVTALLRRRAEQLVASPEIEAIGARLPAVSEDIPRRWVRTMRRRLHLPAHWPRWPIPGG